MKKIEKEFQKSPEEKGITIVALVITIVILIILATIAINAVFGDSGLLQYAQDARNYQTNADASDSELINSATEYIDGIIGGNGSGEETFEPQPTPEPSTGGTEMSDMTNGIIEIKWLSGTSNNVSSLPNAPVIKNDLPSGTTMEQIVFDEESSSWVAGTEYSYVAGTGSNDNTASHWANARVTKDGIESYFVWIPRYAYRIIYFDSAESKIEYQEGTLTEEEAVEQGKIIGYSDSRGIVDGQGRRIESITSPSNTTHTMVSEDYFMVHPAFTTDIENGGWKEEIEGIWIGKYETARSNTNGATQGTATTIKVQPGVTSFRSITIGNMYTYAKAYSTELESHMLKNSEWGVVAYLTESKYGRNGIEIGMNKNSNFLTGGGTGNSYITNANQSSTGNVYGIYDLRGGTWEYVTGYYKDGNSNVLNNGSSYADGTSDEYSTAYSGPSESIAYKYGDAIYETSGWHSDHTTFLLSDYPFLWRGGLYRHEEYIAGVFSYACYDGVNFGEGTFRIAIII